MPKENAWRCFWQNSLGRVGVILLLPIFLMIFMGPSLSGYTYDTLHLTMKKSASFSRILVWNG